MTIQQPTVKGCNPRKEGCEDNVTPPHKLPYCETYSGSDKMKHASNCTYADMVELVPNGPESNALFVPTRIDSTLQQRGCAAGPGGEEKCAKMWKTTSVNKFTYVAGIEDYTVLMRSSYLRQGMVGHSFSHVGFYYQCTTPAGKIVRTNPCEKPNKLSMKEIKCIPGLKCQRHSEGPPMMNSVGLMEVSAEARPSGKLRAGRRNMSSQSLLDASDSEASSRAEEEESPVESGVFAIPGGDVFTIRKLVQLAGLDLDESVDDEGTPLRQRGSAITVNIEYANLKPWRPMTVDVGYIYRIVEQPLDEVKAEVYATHQPKDGDQRVMENRHGIVLNGKVTGSFGVVSPVYVLIMLTTSLALLGVAQKMVDFIAIQLPSKKQAQYKEAKFYKFHPTDAD